MRNQAMDFRLRGNAAGLVRKFHRFTAAVADLTAFAALNSGEISGLDVLAATDGRIELCF